MKTASTTATKSSMNNYLFFWSGQFFSILGSSIISFAIIWWVTVETQSTIYLSIAAFFSFLPNIILSPIAGVVADRWNRKVVIGFSDFAQAFTTIILILAFLTGTESIVFVILINGLRSVFQTFHSPAVNAIIPLMVPQEYLSRINGITRFLSSLINIIAPVVAAGLITFLPMSSILFIDVITFVIAFIPLIIIKIPKSTEIADNILQSKTSFLEDLNEGFVTIRKTPGLLTLAYWSSFINFLVMPFMMLMPYFVNVIHFGEESDFAMVMASMQGGMLLGSLICSFKKNWRNKANTLIFSGLFMTVTYFFTALAPTGQFWFIGLNLFVYGIALSLALTMYYTILQVAVVPEKQGRIFSFDMVLSNIITPITIILAGPLSESIGIVNLFALYAICGISVNVIIGIFTNVRKIDFDNLLNDDQTQIYFVETREKDLGSRTQTRKSSDVV